MNQEYKFGFTACYIQDHPFNHICDIPEDVALLWVNRYIKPSDMQSKQFVIVDGDHGKFLAINYSDYVYSIYLQTGIYSAKKSDLELKRLFESKINELYKKCKVLQEEGSISIVDLNNLPEVKDLALELREAGITNTWLETNGFYTASLILKI